VDYAVLINPLIIVNLFTILSFHVQVNANGSRVIRHIIAEQTKLVSDTCPISIIRWALSKMLVFSSTMMWLVV
jgi:hypothetical protein